MGQRVDPGARIHAETPRFAAADRGLIRKRLLLTGRIITGSDGKGFRRKEELLRAAPSAGTFFFCRPNSRKEANVKRTTKRKVKGVIAYRKSCDASGTGLSHYVLMDKKAR